MQKQGASFEEANANFWVLDHQGLITTQRPGLPEVVAPFARRAADGDAEGESLLDTVRRVRLPHAWLSAAWRVSEVAG
jgi:Malic enzyme, NAD binding domain